MPSPELLPNYVYKILDFEPPSPIPKAFPPSELDKADGFIHLSIASQVPGTASRFFASNTSLWLLKIRYAAIAPSVKWEEAPNTSDWFPHVYGSFGVAETEAVGAFERAEGKDWKEVFAASGWLE